ncbi:hypothetical protein IFM89_015867 [Coptis chinensis]|uniref:Cation efflux protein transmembrane domain-containing protein n=1 Tax=Coptis chinensis TaxID=261450 RepID=A0A835INI6_9MAGN|nr:hypothetical protein IFM89_015867 [Coptis chinensis]
MHKLLIVAVLCVIFMGVEVVGGIKVNSFAILTDVVHLLSDVAAFAISLFSLWASGWEATTRQSYGFFRIEILGALVSIQMIWLLAGILVDEAIVRLIHVHLKLYNPSSSATGQLIYCDRPFCLANKNGPDPGCTSVVRCGSYLQYGDGSSTIGYFVRDSIQYDRVSGNLATTTGNSSIIYGCGLRQMGNLDELRTTLDGILGFG